MVNKYEKLIATELLRAYNRGTKSIKIDKIDAKYSDPFEMKIYDEMNEAANSLSEKGYIKISYTDKKKHDIKSISVIEEMVQHMAKNFHFKTREDLNHDIVSILNKNDNAEYQEIDDFIKKQRERITKGKNVKFVRNGEVNDLNNILIAANAVMSQVNDVFLRNLSSKIFSDSKILENILPQVLEIINVNEEAELDFLQRHHIFKNPIYTMIKGNASIYFQNGGKIILTNNQSMQLSAALVAEITKIETTHVITFENLTTYESYVPSTNDGLVMFLGGFSNNTNIDLLKKAKSQVYHAGDLDANGFRILHDLQRRIGRKVNSLKMNVDVAKQYSQFGKPIDDFNTFNLTHMIEDEKYSEGEKDVFRYLLNEKITIEQESIEYMDVCSNIHNEGE